ncbi:hypothetical protein KIN20_033441 [Parelaphostrongylus tenuis]|uniref:Uncharacterized protein n=1 Tax=Parelaphostrongylus tenuis TaxID=148309 RepID=A0AAD5WIV6_PARTN|nr:hypothetical protein KIN20_033441 [Parelaphostrongylus tenuis]
MVHTFVEEKNVDHDKFLTATTTTTTFSLAVLVCVRVGFFADQAPLVLKLAGFVFLLLTYFYPLIAI